jgi:hypothetical protein
MGAIGLRADVSSVLLAHIIGWVSGESLRSATIFTFGDIVCPNPEAEDNPVSTRKYM